jgi:hypothetical protein
MANKQIRDLHTFLSILAQVHCPQRECRFESESLIVSLNTFWFLSSKYRQFLKNYFSLGEILMCRKLYFVLFMMLAGAAHAGVPLFCPPAAQVITSSVIQGVVQFIPPQHTILNDGEENTQSNFRWFNSKTLELKIKPENVLGIDAAEYDHYDDFYKYEKYRCDYNLHYKVGSVSGNIFVQITYAPGKK